MRWSRIGRVALWIAGGLLGLLLVAVGGAVILLNTDFGGRRVAELVSAVASSPNSATHIGNIRLYGLDKIVITDIGLSDRQGQWGHVDRVALDWAPSALLGGQLRFETADAANVHVARMPLPSPTPQPSTGGFKIPNVPPIRVQDISIAPIRLDEPVLGEAMTLRLNGSFGLHASQAILTHAAVERLDRSGHIVLDAAYHPKRPSLDLKLSVDEAEGGLIARLAKLPGTPAISINLAGSGPLDNWRGELQADFAELAELSGRVAGDIHPPGRFHGNFAATFGPLMPTEVKQALGGRASLDFVTDMDQGKVEVERLALDTPTVRVAASGTVDRANGRIPGFTLTATVPSGADLQHLLGSTQLGSANLTLHLEGPLSGPKIRIAAAANDVAVNGIGRLPRVAARANLVAPIGATAPDPVPIEIAAEVSYPAFQQQALDTLTGEQLTLTGKAMWNRKASGIAIDDLKVQGELFALTGAGSYDLGQKAVNAKLALTIDRLRAAAPGARGQARVEFAVDGSLTGALVADLSARAEDLAYPSVPIVDVLGSSPTVDAHIRREANGTIHLAELDVEGKHLALHSTRCDIAEAVECRIEGRLDTLTPLSDLAGTQLAGSVSLQIQAEGPRSDPRIAASITARDGRIGATKFDRLALDARVREPIGDTSGNLSLVLEAPAGNAHIASDFAMAEKRSVLRISKLAITAPGMAAGGQLAIRLKQKLASGALDLRIIDAGQLAAVAGARAQGKATATFRLSDAGGKQDFTATIHADSLHFRTHSNSVYRVASTDVRAEGRNIFSESSSLSAHLQGAHIAAASVHLDTLIANASGSLDRLDIRAALSGQIARSTGEQPVSLNLAAEVDRTKPNATMIRLARLDGEALGIDLALRRPARIALAQEETRIEGLDLAVNQGSVTVSAQVSPQVTTADVALHDLPASIFNVVRPTLNFAGEFNGAARVTARPGGGKGTLDLRFAGLRPKPLVERTLGTEPPTVSGRIEGDWNGDRATVSGQVAGLSSTDVTLRASIPLSTPPNSAVPQLVRTAPLSAHVDWKGAIGPIWAFLPLVEHRLTGEASVVADVAGTIASPRISANGRLIDARYENLVWGTVLDNFTVSAEVRSNQYADVAMSATDGGRNGTLKGSARIGLSGTEHPIDAAVEMRNFHVARRDDATAIADARLTVTGPLKSAQIAGTVTTDKAEVLLTAKLPPSVVTLDIRQVNGPPENPANLPTAGKGTIEIRNTVAEPALRKPAIEATKSGQAPSFAMPLDIHVRMPNNVFVRGRGLTSEWQGNLRVQGTTAAPRIFGSLGLVRGDFAIAGKTIELDDSSTITFSGTTTIDPALNITATISEAEITATLKVIGRTSAPKIELSSSPSLPQDEILAQILFGKSTTNLSPFEALQLASAVGELSGLTGSGPGIMSKMRTSLGLDVLRLQTNEHGQTTVGAGKYIGKRVYVGVQQGAQASTGEVTVNIDVTDHLSVETAVGAAANNRAGINWKYDY